MEVFPWIKCCVPQYPPRSSQSIFDSDSDDEEETWIENVDVRTVNTVTRDPELKEDHDDSSAAESNGSDGDDHGKRPIRGG